MHNPSPFDLIRKATTRANTSDRWAALLNNTQERIPIVRDTPPAKQSEQSYEQPAYENASYPQLLEPPFPPPQARHPMLDEIAQRHMKALKNASKQQEWLPRQAAQAPKAEAPAEEKE